MEMIGQTLGDFEVLQEIGRGGMGVVYKARQASLDRLVALKVLPAEYARDETAAERFTREAHNMARLRHPNIVDVIEVGEQDGVRYFAMQYVEGESLQALMGREGAVAPERTAELAAQVADALFHAHEQGVVHRDIKPGNILVDEHGRAVVTDFGIAKTAEGTSLTSTGASIGTPEYMSPELVRGNPIDGRSDLYSLGIVLFQMVTGRVPFTATTPVAVAMKHVSEPPTPPRALGAECPEWLESITLKALAKEPSDRFGSGAEMAAALRAGVPVAPPTQEFHAPGGARPAPPGVPSPTPSSAGTRIAWVVGILGAAMITFAIGVWVATRSAQSGGGHDGANWPPESPHNMMGPQETSGTTPGMTTGEGMMMAPSGSGSDGPSPMEEGMEPAMVPEPPRTPEPTPEPSAREECEEVVRRFHAAITRKSYPDARACFTRNATNVPSQHEFEDPDDYGNTEYSRAVGFRNFVPSGDKARIDCTIEFKDYGQPSDSTQHQYQLRRVNGEWLISSKRKI